MSDTQRERELKFDLPDTWVLPDVSRFVPDGGSVQIETQRLESTYFDTPARDLFGSLVTLRRRTGDADTGWHLKIPMDGARQEIRVPLAAGRGVPAELRALTAGLRGRAALRTVATLRTERAVRRIVDADGVGVIEIVHDTVTATVKHEFSIIRSWHEAEVELLERGDEKLLGRVARWLGKHGAEPSASLSKLGRALEASAHPPRSTSTAAGVIGAYLDANYSAIVAGDVTLRRAAGSELPADELHDAIHAHPGGPAAATAARCGSSRRCSTPDRAATSRRRAVLVRGRPGRGPRPARPAPAPRRRVRPSSRPIWSSDPLAAGSRAPWTSRRPARAPRWSRSWPRLATWACWASCARGPPTCPRTMPTSRRRRWSATCARRRRRWTSGAGPRTTPAPRCPPTMPPRRPRRSAIAAFHRARKAAKRARYAAELAVPVLGRTARQLAKRAKKRQERLGDRQDEVVAAEFLLRLGATGGNGFTLGVLYQRERDLAEGTD